MSKSYTELAIWPPPADVVREAGRRPPIPRRPIDFKPTTRAGQYLCRRLRIPPGHADLIAALAGLGSAVDR